MESNKGVIVNMKKAGRGWRINKEKEVPIQCSLIKKPIIYIEPIPKRKIELLMNKYPHQEWLGYLVGKMSERENFFVEDLTIPPHKEVSAASAEAEPFFTPEKCIGVIHSHHGMGAFHSGTDQDYVDKNFPISITVAKRGDGLEFDAVSYQTTLCGKNVTTQGTVKYVQPNPMFDSESFMREAEINIEKGRPKTKAITMYRGNQSYHQNSSPVIIGNNGEALTVKEYQELMKGVWSD